MSRLRITNSDLVPHSTDRQSNLSGERVAILVNDMLNDFIKGALRSDRASKIISSIKDLLFIARTKDIPVFYCNDEHEEDDPELKIWGPHSMKGTEGSQVIPELKLDQRDCVVPKRFYGAFDSTNLDTLLKESYSGRGNRVNNYWNSYPYLYKTHSIWGIHQGIQYHNPRRRRECVYERRSRVWFILHQESLWRANNANL